MIWGYMYSTLCILGICQISGRLSFAGIAWVRYPYKRKEKNRSGTSPAYTWNICIFHDLYHEYLPFLINIHVCNTIPPTCAGFHLSPSPSVAVSPCLLLFSVTDAGNNTLKSGQTWEPFQFNHDITTNPHQLSYTFVIFAYT